MGCAQSSPQTEKRHVRKDREEFYHGYGPGNDSDPSPPRHAFVNRYGHYTNIFPVFSRIVKGALLAFNNATAVVWLKDSLVLNVNSGKWPLKFSGVIC